MHSPHGGPGAREPAQEVEACREVRRVCVEKAQFVMGFGEWAGFRRWQKAGRHLRENSSREVGLSLPLEGPAEGAAMMDMEGSHLSRTWDGHHRPDRGGL